MVFDHDVALESRLRWMTVAGGALAGLHGASDMPAPTQTLAGDIAELDALAAPMAQAAAELAHSFRSVVAALHEARAVDGAASAVDGAASAVDGAAVVSHGAFRTDQFMIEDDGLVMIDLDTLCRARPERDVGNLLAYLRWRALRKPRDAALVAVAPQHFIAGYEESGRRLDEGRTNLFEAASLLKIAGRRFRSLTVREWDLVPELITAARRLLE